MYAGQTPELKAVSAPVRVPKNMTKGELDTTHILAGGDPYCPKVEVTPGVLSAVGDAAVPGDECMAAVRHWRSGSLTGKPAHGPGDGEPHLAMEWARRSPATRTISGPPARSQPFGVTGLAAAEQVRSRPPRHCSRSIKPLLRLIVRSEAYRRASRHPDPPRPGTKDPPGTSYAVFRPRRLSAEELRDTLLAVSGELNPAVGGIPVRPEINPDVALNPGR